MTWTLFSQIFILIILLYLCIRALIIAYFENVVMAETVVARKLREDEIIRQQFGIGDIEK